MKKLLILSALALLPVLACAQERVQSPKVIAWDGSTTSYEIAIESYDGEIIILGTTEEKEYYIDLQANEYYGLFVVLIRGVEFTEPDMFDYSEWARSDNPEDVIIIDGVEATFHLENRRKAIIPSMLRIK